MAEEDPGGLLRDAERMKFFTDAVVAIAMTLLILPLLESVADVKGERLTTSQFLDEHSSQLVSFLISFAVIASFWVSHERVYGRVEHWTPPLMLLNMGWMLTIVFLPIAAALSGAMHTDRLQLVIYIGDMLVTSLLMGGVTLLIHRDPRIRGADVADPGVGAIAASLASVILFSVALAVALAFPAINYFALFILFLTGPLQAGLERVLTPRRR